MPRFTVGMVSFGKPSFSLPRCFVSFTYALVKPKLYFPAGNLNRSFKFPAAHGFFRKGGWGKTLFSGKKRVFPKKIVIEKQKGAELCPFEVHFNFLLWPIIWRHHIHSMDFLTKDLFVIQVHPLLPSFFLISSCLYYIGFTF